jgi:hypothetical protein
MNKAVIGTVRFQTVFRQYLTKEGIQRTHHFRFGINLKIFFVHLKEILNDETDFNTECICQK